MVRCDVCDEPAARVLLVGVAYPERADDRAAGLRHVVRVCGVRCSEAPQWRGRMVGAWKAEKVGAGNG